MGEAWIGAEIDHHLRELCDRIGPRWSSTDGERKATVYIRDQLLLAGLADSGLEEYQLDTWALRSSSAHLRNDDRPLHILPFNRCPAFKTEGRLVDVGYGTMHEIAAAAPQLVDAVVLLKLGFEPFTEPVPLAYRLQAVAEAGAAAAIVIDRKDGGRVEYHNASDWRNPGLQEHPLPTVAVARETGALLCRHANQCASITLHVDAEFYRAPSWNVAGSIVGSRWPDEHLLIGAHHDTVYGSPGGNDNGSGIAVLLETARLLAGVCRERGIAPGRSIRFVSFSAEEQKFQGSNEYVFRHYAEGQEVHPRLAINLDELSTGPIKGLVLAFPHLRPMIRRQLHQLGDDLKCHVMSQLDGTSDHFPFLRAGIDAAHLWRWRFAGRHADSDFHHEAGDTLDKVNIRELKEYSGQLARILLRLSHTPPVDWPANPQTPATVERRLEAERGSVVRIY
jgi:hypothetical protein